MFENLLEGRDAPWDAGKKSGPRLRPNLIFFMLGLGGGEEDESFGRVALRSALVSPNQPFVLSEGLGPNLIPGLRLIRQTESSHVIKIRVRNTRAKDPQFCVDGWQTKPGLQDVIRPYSAMTDDDSFGTVTFSSPGFFSHFTHEKL